LADLPAAPAGSLWRHLCCLPPERRVSSRKHVPLRLIFVLTVVLIGTLASWNSPFRALLFYLWFAYFRPDYWVGWIPFVSQMRLSLWIGMFVLFAALITAKKRFGPGSTLMLLFFLDTALATQWSLANDWSEISWRKFIPAVIMGYVIPLLITSEKRLRLALVA